MIDWLLFLMLMGSILLIAYGSYREGVGRERERWERRVNCYPFVPIEDRPATRDDQDPRDVGDYGETLVRRG